MIFLRGIEQFSEQYVLSSGPGRAFFFDLLSLFVAVHFFSLV